MYVWLDREISLDLMEEFAGNRITSSYISIGGVKRDMTPAIADKMRKGMDKLEGRMAYYRRAISEERTVR